MVEVFRTNVQTVKEATFILEQLSLYFPDCEISFDLEDIDRVLRIAGKRIECGQVLLVLNEAGSWGEVLE